MSRFSVLLIRHFLLLIGVVILIPHSLVALEQGPRQIKKLMTCFTLEETSNEFGIVQLNFQTNEVRATFYIAGLDDHSSTRMITEYDEKNIANLEKIGSCFPVQKKITFAGVVKGIEFADGCLVNDPSREVYSSSILYKVDFVRQSGAMSVKNFDWDTKLYSERKYFLYQCFEPGE